METMTGSYTVSSNPSMINESSSVLRTFAFAFNILPSKMGVWGTTSPSILLDITTSSWTSAGADKNLHCFAPNLELHI